MIDFAHITVRAGDGGNGSGSRKQIVGKRYGKADGGDGGRGGDAYFEATADLNSLEPYRYVKDYAAEGGTQGYANQRRGATAPDFVLKVPVGTQITVDFAGGREEDERLSRKKVLLSPSQKAATRYDLTRDGEKILIARGGMGGRGNTHLRDELGHRPSHGELGQKGEMVTLTLELKLIAQVGLIGLPNAGKSTLLASITRAKPEIAAYPFTTLEPNLGVLQLPRRRIIIADVPGLIAGASEGKGLGHAFLRHIERTKLLVHLVDVSKGPEELWADYETVRNELNTFSPSLRRKKEIIVLSKTDLANHEQIQEVGKLFRGHDLEVLTISAATGEGLNQLISEITAKSK